MNVATAGHAIHYNSLLCVPVKSAGFKGVYHAHCNAEFLRVSDRLISWAENDRNVQAPESQFSPS